MRVVRYDGAGGVDVVTFDERALPEPWAGQVRVRVRAVGVNRADLLQRAGHYPPPPGVPPDVPGLEFAGVIDALGAQVSGWTAGAPVMGIVGGGAYAAFLTTDADHLSSIPPDMTFTDAAAIPEVFITAHDALERLAVAPGEWVLVRAVGSGVGTAALQLIKHRGAHCIGTSRTQSKLDRAMNLGMDAGVDTSRDRLGDRIRAIVDGGVAAVLDLVGGQTFATCLDTLAPRGRALVVGLTAGRRADIDLGIVLQRRLRIEGTVLRSRPPAEKTDVIRSFNRDVLPLFAAGQIRPIVDRVFPFEAVRDAQAAVESNATFGKVILQLPPS